MFNFLKQFNLQFQTFLGGLSVGKRMFLLFLLGTVMIGFIVMIVWSQNSNYQLLYANLSQDDAASIMLKLKELKVPYRISGDGNSIMIPENMIYETRLQLANEGLPQGGGIGYELFDKSTFGLTEFVQKLNYQRALQGELSRTINQIAEVDKSRVHLVMPEKTLFIEDQEDATASVLLKLHPGRKLKKEQIQGIVHLVASGVIGLKPHNITVVDQYGNILLGGESSFLGQISNSQLEYQNNLERRLENRVQTILEKVVGKGGVIARVSASLDFSQIEKTEERYDPESQVVRSQSSTQEKSSGKGAVPAGVPGVASNLPGQQSQSFEQGASSDFKKTNETINYEINKITERIVEPVVNVNKLSVAVLVDGKRELINGKEEYLARTNEEIEKYENIVKSAIGYNEKRKDQVVIENIAFEKISLGEEDGLIDKVEQRRFYISAIKYAGSALLILLGFLFIIRPIMNSLATGIQKGSIHQLPKTVGELEAEIEGTEKEREGVTIRNKVVNGVKENPKQAADLVRTWLDEKK